MIPEGTLHDWYAGQALAGLLASGKMNDVATSDVIREAFEIADMVMDERGNLDPDRGMKTLGRD